MKIIKAISVEDNLIILSSADDLEKIFELINKDENFILQWVKNKMITSEMIIATNITAKVKTGELVLRAVEQ